MKRNPVSRFASWLLLALALSVGIAGAQEKVTLSTPVLTDAGATTFRVTMIHLDWEVKEVVIRLRQVDGAGALVPGGKRLEVQYTGAEATSVMQLVNNANFSTTSMQKRTIQRLQADGKLGSGSVTGTAE